MVLREARLGAKAIELVADLVPLADVTTRAMRIAMKRIEVKASGNAGSAHRPTNDPLHMKPLLFRQLFVGDLTVYISRREKNGEPVNGFSFSNDDEADVDWFTDEQMADLVIATTVSQAASLYYKGWISATELADAFRPYELRMTWCPDFEVSLPR